MSLYGALFSGVSGLNAQGSSIAALGDNISNINTVGYKSVSTAFSTLVTDSDTSTNYSSGGVSSKARKLVDQQGLLQGTGVVTDLAVSGNGFFVVNSKPDGQGDYVYTRAGSFRKDSRGNFVNSAGYTLMAWPLDNEERLPGQPNNLDTTPNALLDSLKPVNVKSVSGVASATTAVEVGLNLNAAQELLQGAGQTVTFPTTALGNKGIGADDIIVPEALSPTRLEEGNSFTLNTGTLTNYTYTYIYGGFVQTKDITTGGGVLGALTPAAPFAAATSGDNFTITNETTGTVTFTYIPNSPTTTIGQFNSLNTLAEAIDNVSGLSARVQNNILYIAPEDATESLTFTDLNGSFTTALAGNVAAGTETAQNRFASLQGLADLVNASTGVKAVLENPLDSTTIDIYASDPLDTLNFFAADARALPRDGFTSGAAGSNVVTVSDPAHGLANGDYVYFPQSIIFDGVTVASGSYIIAGATANTYTIVASAGTATTGGLSGGDSSIRAIPTLATDPFTTGAAGSSVVTVTQAAHGLSTGDHVTFHTDTVVDGVTISEGAYEVTVTGANTYTITGTGTATVGAIAGGGDGIPVSTATNEILGEFGLTTLLGTIAPAYDPSGASAPNISSGNVTPHFSRNVRFFDALGSGHDFQMSFVKLAPNTWSLEVYALDPAEIVTSRVDGQIASGTVVFNGDGSLRSLSPGLTQPIDIVWANKATPSAVRFDFGTQGQVSGTLGATNIGKTDGLRQFESAYDVQFVDQNGVASGLLTSVNVDVDGYVTANFSNGETRKLFKIPLADFANPNGLEARAGNVYAESQASGNFNLKEPGSGGVGKVAPASLEQANVELADELTKMLIAQRGYQASAKVIKTSDDLLDELNRVFSG